MAAQRVDSDGEDESGPQRPRPVPSGKVQTMNEQPGAHPDAMKGFLSGARSTWRKFGIDLRTYKQMFKGALAPTIALAAFQGTAFAEFYATVGYLVGIMAVLSVPIQPRAKFIQTMLINILFSCVACAVALLAMFCTIRARINSTGFNGPGEGGPGTSGLASAGAETAGYNSSASAIAGVWLFAEIYFISIIRGKNPKYTIPCIMAAIFANVSCAYAPQFNTMEQAENFAYHLLTAFLTGFAIATGVSLFIFPLTSRQVVFKGMAGYIVSLRGAVQSNLVYLRSLEESDMFAGRTEDEAESRTAKSTEAQVLKEKMRALTTVNAKLHLELPFAKREIALGKLDADVLQKIARMLRLIMIPTIGLSCTSDIFDLIVEERGWIDPQNLDNGGPGDTAGSDEKLRIEVVHDWHELMKKLREPFNDITQAIDDGLEHVAITLQLTPRSNAKVEQDVEAGRQGPLPGGKDFTAAYERRARQFLKSKETMLRSWCSLHDIQLPDDFFENPKKADFGMPDWMSEGYLSGTHRKLRRQLFLCLYIEFLLYDISRRTHQLMLFADGLRDSGDLSRTRLIVPGLKRLRKWSRSLFTATEDSHVEDEIDTDGQIHSVYLGEGFKQKKDPEHLPPQNVWERFSDNLRIISHFFQSPASAFGFRTACATMSIAIIAFLSDTQVFYTDQRLFWAQIMISISMNPSAAQGLRNFCLRVAGTTFAMLFSWIAWYIVDGHTAGVLVFFFILVHLGPYILLKHPQFTTLGMIGPVTMVLIIGYELQARKIGVANAESNGQVYYPIYELGPIRLATVAGGLFVAWIWTIFPYPISEHGQLRKNLGSTLYLLANYYSVMHETVRMRLKDEQGDMNIKQSPGRQLEKARTKIFSKANLTLNSLRAQCSFLKFDIPVGGKFPQAQYQRLIDDMQNALHFMSLISLASFTFTELHEQFYRESGLKWLANFRKLVNEANITSQQVTTLLSLMSAAVINGQALPPYIRVPEAYILAQRLDELDKDLLSVRHIAEPGYASFAVMQIGTKCIVNDIKRIVKGVKELVGEMDFSYHIVSTSSGPDSAETLVFARDDGSQQQTKQD